MPYAARKIRRRIFLVAALALPLLSLPGCGDEAVELVPVKGKVLLNGQPLTIGSITTTPPTGRGAYAPIGPDGTFELTSGREPGAVPGVHKVAVVATEGAGFQGAEAPATTGKSLVPAHYNNADSSELTIDVKADGDNSPVLELTGP